MVEPFVEFWSSFLIGFAGLITTNADTLTRQPNNQCSKVAHSQALPQIPRLLHAQLITN